LAVIQEQIPGLSISATSVLAMLGYIQEQVTINDVAMPVSFGRNLNIATGGNVSKQRLCYNEGMIFCTTHQKK